MCAYDSTDIGLFRVVCIGVCAPAFLFYSHYLHYNAFKHVLLGCSCSELVHYATAIPSIVTSLCASNADCTDPGSVQCVSICHHASVTAHITSSMQFLLLLFCLLADCVAALSAASGCQT